MAVCDPIRQISACAAVLAFFSCIASAQIMTEPPAERLPPQLNGVGIEQRLNQRIPLNLMFRDESGQTVQLSNYFNKGKPVLLSLVYYQCTMLCSQVLSSIADSLRLVKFDAGKDFTVLTVSFDPNETPAMAAAAKKQYLGIYRRPGAERGWHFLTGDESSTHVLAEAVGFQYYWDKYAKQFAHATGIMLLTPDGRVAQYYYGARYFPTDLRFGLIQASQNQIGTLADQIVLYCYHYDPRVGRYGVIVSRVIQLSGGITLLIFGSFLIFLFKNEPNRRWRTRKSALDREVTNPVSAGHATGAAISRQGD
jgi:protein SCO1/2